MSLRRKLVYLHAAFAAFAVAAAFATVHGVQVRVNGAVRSFQGLVDHSISVDQIRVDLREQVHDLREIVDRRREISAAYLARRDACFIRLTEVARFAARHSDESDWRGVVDLGQRLREDSERCLALTRASQPSEGKAVLAEEIEADVAAALDTRLRNIRTSLDARRRQSGNQILATNAQLLGLAVMIGVTGVGLLAVGVFVIRRSFISPLAALRTATREFGEGNLDYRVTVSSKDELGALGASLNTMASSLRVSQTKYKSLFENLRDAVIICDSAGIVVECHDSDTKLLGVSPEASLGRHLLEVWPAWASAGSDWGLLVARVAANGERSSAVAVNLPRQDGKSTLVDVVAYPVQYAEVRYTAILLRDVTDRQRLQRLVRRSETMEAAGTFARGIAHDFRNFLNSAVSTLSLIESQAGNSRNSELVQTAIRSCQHATALSKRLSAFADIDQGNPEVHRLGEIVELILSALDEPFLAALRIRNDCDRSVAVRMDQDHLTQVVLNLIHNAREAMPDGGDLRIATDTVIAANPIERSAPSRYAVLTVADTGCGMDDSVKERLFEPLFTTKARDRRAGRGLGLAVVYAVVNNAGGFIQVDSEIGVGTTFRVYLPSGEEIVSPGPRQTSGPTSKTDTRARDRRPRSVAPDSGR
ncbi:MAG: HAMP domain-containing protein [bacterium]|nr:HAMP domain-containing protein [bacterium]